MALVTFTNNQAPYLNAENLNNNFNYSVPLGGIVQFAGTTAPNGWLICDGSEVSRETYSDLFAIIGTTYGAGDESTTFNLPNLKGRVPVGYDSTQTEFDNLGETGGEKKHTLTVNEMPSHQHELSLSNYGNDSCSAVDWKSTNTGGKYSYSGDMLQATGGNQPHNILQPYIVLNYIIKY